MSVRATILRFTVPGEPCPKERPRVFSSKTTDGRVISRAVTPKKTRAYEDKVRTMAQIAVNQWKWSWSKDDRFNVIVRVFRTYEGKGGDLDNYCKSAVDSLIGVAIPDDRHVRGLGVALDQDAKNPRLEIEVHRYRRKAA